MLRLVLLLGLFVTIPVFGEDSSSKFFTKDYAKNPLEQTEATPKEKQNQVKQENPTVAENKSSTVNTGGFSEVDTSKESLTNEPGRPIKWLGLIVTSEPKTQMTQVFKTMQKIVRRHDLAVGLIYIIGPSFSKEDGKVISELMMRGGQIKVRGRSPTQFGAKRSPTWIIELEKGEVLLDGILDPTFFLNENGEYVGESEKVASINQ